MSGLGDPKGFPGQTRVAWRKEKYRVVLAAIAGALWPPLVITLPLWRPHNWIPGLEMDWRLVCLLAGLVAVPLGFWLLERERRRIGRPSTRLGVVWRFMFYGGLASGGIATAVALGMLIAQWISSQSVGQALGSTASTLLIYGVGGLPVSVLVGVSWALWAGLCAAFIAFRPQPEVKDRMGVMGKRADR